MAELPVLDPVEQRLLGSLLEKQRTVPASYPLTLNSLRLACNQSSSRDPLSDYDDDTLQRACRALKDRGLLRVVWADKGTRTLKYHQLLDAELSLQPDERALLTVLLLRGAQAPGELKTRTERLHPFADRAEVEATLTRMAGALPPLVRELERRAGQQDRRWIHLLGPVPTEAVAAGAAAVDREAILAEGAGARDAKVVAAYDAVADAYAEALGDELIDKPFDLWLLERIADLAKGPIADLGCGPGHISAFLADTGAEVHGFDASAAMVARARADFPDLDFQVVRFHQFLRPRTAPAWGAVVAWYSFVHLAPSELTEVLRRVAATATGGVVAFAVHLGDEVRHVDELTGVAVDLDFVLHDREQVVAAAAAAGLSDVEWYERGPQPSEAQTRRLYVLGRVPQ